MKPLLRLLPKANALVFNRMLSNNSKNQVAIALEKLDAIIQSKKPAVPAPAPPKACIDEKELKIFEGKKSFYLDNKKLDETLKKANESWKGHSPY